MQRIINNQNKTAARKQLRRNQTPQEIILWSKIRNNQTGHKWKRQVSIGRYIADFYCRQKLLVIEIDGSQHISNKEYDNERDLYFLSFGIRTMRFWNNEINTNIGGVLQKIEGELGKKPHPNPLLKGEGANQPHHGYLLKGEGANQPHHGYLLKGEGAEIRFSTPEATSHVASRAYS